MGRAGEAPSHSDNSKMEEVDGVWTVPSLKERAASRATSLKSVPLPGALFSQICIWLVLFDQTGLSSNVTFSETTQPKIVHPLNHALSHYTVAFFVFLPNLFS